MGFEPDRFVYGVPQDSYCAICNLVLQDPLEIITCGHFVCSVCWRNWTENNKNANNLSNTDLIPCPFCGIEINGENTRKSKITWNLIQNMNVYCEKKSEGCECVYKLGFNDLHRKNCLYDDKQRAFVEKLEKCQTCNITLDEDADRHSCVKELAHKLSKQQTELLNLEHENNRLLFKLTTCEKEIIGQKSELEGQFFQDSVKCQKEIRDLRTRLACLQGELATKNGMSEVQRLCINIERLNGSLGFNIIGGASQDDKLSSGIYVSRITEGGAADRPDKLRLHDCILEVDSVDLSNATHDLAVKTFRNSGNPVKMVVQRLISKSKGCDATTQTFGVMFAVTGGEDAETETPEETTRTFKNGKSRWLNPHELADSVGLSGSDETLNMIQENNNSNKDEHKSDQYDSAYDTLLTQKSSRSTRNSSHTEQSDIDSSCNTVKTSSPDSSDTQGVVLRKKVTKDSDDGRRQSTFIIVPSSDYTDTAVEEKGWEDILSETEQEGQCEYEYEEVNLDKGMGKFGMVLCYGGDGTDVAVFVGDLEENSVADTSGKIMVGDQIVQINGVHVNDVEQAYKMLQENDKIALIVARAVYDEISEYYDEAEETDLDALDCINEEDESMFSKTSSPIYASSVSSKSSGNPKEEKSAFSNDSTPSSPMPTRQTGRSRAMTLSPVHVKDEEFQLPERRGRSTSVNDSSSLDEKIDRKRNASAESNKTEKESRKSSFKNFMKNKLGNTEKKHRTSSHSDDSCEFNKIPRCDSNSSNNSNRSRNSSEKENLKLHNDPHEQLKAKQKEQKNISKMKAYLDSPSLQRHRINNNMVIGQNNVPFVNQNMMYPSQMVPVFTQMNPGMTQMYPVMMQNHPMNGMLNNAHMNYPVQNRNPHPLQNRNSMTASVSSLRSAMKNSAMNNNNNTINKQKKQVHMDPHPGWNETEKRVWEEFKIIQSMESKENKDQKLDPEKVEAEWRVRRSKDGKHVYIKKTNSSRSKVLKERAEQISNERCGLTTDDDAFTVYQGQYWSRDQRKKQLTRHNDRRRRLDEKAAVKAAFENKTEKAMAEIVQRRMNVPNMIYDNFITVEEILSQRNRSGILDGPIHVTTI